MKWLFIAVMALSAAATVSSIGKPRQPVTTGQAAITVAVDIVIVFIVAAKW